MAIYVDFETPLGKRRIVGVKSDDIELISKKFGNMKNSGGIVRYINGKTGETIKGPKFDTTQQELYPADQTRLQGQMGDVKIQEPIEPSQHEPRDRFQ